MYGNRQLRSKYQLIRQRDKLTMFPFQLNVPGLSPVRTRSMCRTRIATGGTSLDTGQGSSGMAEQSTSARPCHPRGTPGSSSSKEQGKHPTLDEVTVEQCCALPSGSTSLQSLCMRPASPLQGHCPLSPPRSLRCVVWRLHPSLAIPPTFRN